MQDSDLNATDLMKSFNAIKELEHNRPKEGEVRAHNFPPNWECLTNSKSIP